MKESIMKAFHQILVSALVASGITLVTGLHEAGSAPAVAASAGNTVVAAALGAVAATGGETEAVVFSGQASIKGKVVHDNVFGAPPVLEIVVDMSQVIGKGQRSGKAYQVSGQLVVHRPLQAFEPVEVTFPFYPDGNVLASRSATASFGLYYNASNGITTTRVLITPNVPA
jgi:hypothetical protein